MVQRRCSFFFLFKIPFNLWLHSSKDNLLLQVFEDENEAVRYCDLLQGGGQGCEGVAEIEASSVSLSKLLVYLIK